MGETIALRLPDVPEGEAFSWADAFSCADRQPCVLRNLRSDAQGNCLPFLLLITVVYHTDANRCVSVCCATDQAYTVDIHLAGYTRNGTC